MEQKRTIAKLLRSFIDLLERSSAADLEDLASGRAHLEICGGSDSNNARAGTRPRDTEKLRQPYARQLGSIVEELRALGSRNAGFDLLARHELSKRDLEAMARLMDLPVVREDNADQLRRKIVEASIGARLNSEAIRGE